MFYLVHFGIVMSVWYIMWLLSTFGMFYQEKPGNPAMGQNLKLVFIQDERGHVLRPTV
jgi:hypothetical protein